MSVGKTSIMNRFVSQKFNPDSYKSTIGVDFSTKDLVVRPGSAGLRWLPSTPSKVDLNLK